MSFTLNEQFGKSYRMKKDEPNRSQKNFTSLKTRKICHGGQSDKKILDRINDGLNGAAMAGTVISGAKIIQSMIWASDWSLVKIHQSVRYWESFFLSKLRWFLVLILQCHSKPHRCVQFELESSVMWKFLPLPSICGWFWLRFDPPAVEKSFLGPKSTSPSEIWHRAY